MMNSLIVAFFVTAGAPPAFEANSRLAGGAEVHSAVVEAEEPSASVTLVQPAIRSFEIGAPTFDPSKPEVGLTQ